MVEVLAYQSRSREVDEIGRKQISVLLPPGALESLKPSAPPAPRPTVKVDPREIRKIAPTITPPVQPPPQPQPQPEPPKKELPSAPTPQPNAIVRQHLPSLRREPRRSAQAAGEAGNAEHARATERPDLFPRRLLPAMRFEMPRGLRRRTNSPVPIAGSGQIPGGARRGGGSGGHGTAGAGVEMLTDTQGVDFNDYLRRVYLTVKQNWFAVMPASVQLGDQGVVSLHSRLCEMAACRTATRNECLARVRSRWIARRFPRFARRIRFPRCRRNSRDRISSCGSRIITICRFPPISNTMKIARQQVLGSLLLALIVLIILLVRAWPVLFHK